MIKFAARKVSQAVAILFLVTLAVQILSSLVPGSPGELLLGPSAGHEAIAKFNHQYGFDRPFWDRYWSWLTGAVHGDLGDSIQTHQTVTHVVFQHLPTTLEVALGSMVIALLIAISVSLYCAAHEDNLVDRAVTGLSSAFLSVPSFVGCVLLATLLTSRFKVFPVYGWVDFTKDPYQNIVHVVLPITVLVLGICPLFLRVLRADLVSIMREDFVLAARARGMTDRYIVVRHALRPASLSLFTLAGLSFGYLLGGSIIIETYFALPGLGQLVGSAVANNDLPMVQGVVVLVAVVFLIINTLVDLSYRLINPQAGVRK